MKLKEYNDEERLKEFEYLKSNVFNGLENLNDGFDSESIYYFSESDFEIVLNRVEENGIAIFGIEPWLNGDFYDVRVERTDKLNHQKRVKLSRVKQVFKIDSFVG